MLGGVERRAVAAVLALALAAGAAGCGDDAPAEAPTATAATTTTAAEPATTTTSAPAPPATTEAAPFDEDDLVAAGILTAADLPPDFTLDAETSDGREDPLWDLDTCAARAYAKEAYRREISRGFQRIAGNVMLGFRSHVYLYLDDDLAEDAFAAVAGGDGVECQLQEGLQQVNRSPRLVDPNAAEGTATGEIEELEAPVLPADDIAGWRTTYRGLPSEGAADYEPVVGEVWFLRVGRALVTVDVNTWRGPPPEDEVRRVLDLLATRVAAAPQGESVPTSDP